MQWKVEQFIFCERQQLLTDSYVASSLTSPSSLSSSLRALKPDAKEESDKKSGKKNDKKTKTELNRENLANSTNDEHDSIQLEPMVAELLAYFCRNPNTTISRDQLIEHVWAGRVITDNAVTKVITKLRKNLRDDPKSPKFITTYPKKGYRFIASVSEYLVDLLKVEDSNATNGKVVLNKWPKPTPYVASFLGLLFIFVLGGVSYESGFFDRKQPTFTSVKAITRDPGRESRPAISPDHKYLAYSETRNSKMRLWIKSLSDQSTIEVSHGDSKSVWVDSASWSSDGSQFVYLVTTSNTCQYFIRDFNQLEIGEPRLIHNCPAGSYGKISFTHDDNRVVYSEAASRGAPFELFELNLETSKKRRLNQPELFIGGNSQFDLHPTKNKLLISSPNAQQWEGFFSLDLDSDELILLFEQDAYICCGRWDHSGTRVILMGDHPSTSLVSFDLNGENRQVIYSGSDQVRVPERHPNGRDYIFPIAQVNQNSNYFDFESKVSNEVANSSVDDRIPTFAHHDDLIAYVGVSSGSEEIWTTDLSGKSKKKLTNLNGNQHYIDLGWSYDGKYLYALTLNEIHLIDSITGLKKTLKIPQVEIRGVSWKNNQTLAFSLKSDAGWQVSNYNIFSDQLTPDSKIWQFIRYSEEYKNIIWQNHEGIIFQGEDQKIISDPEIQSAGMLAGRRFNLRKTGDRWVWLAFEKGRPQLMEKVGVGSKTNTILHPDVFHFDLSSEGVLYQTLIKTSSDLYLTLSE